MFLLLYCHKIDFNDNETPGKLMIILTLFSAYAFLVNFYLGGRFLTSKDDKSNMGIIVSKSKIVEYYWYIICCIMNWTIQIILFIDIIKNGFFNLRYGAYMFILGFIIKDDLILMKWLRD